MFIVFEGMDGSGKSTQARLLAESLQAEGREVILTREPGGSPAAEEIRRLILQGPALSPMSTLLLFNAARRDHVETLIRPALARGAVVVCDRFEWSTLAYQGSADPSLVEVAQSLHDQVIGLRPDMVVLLTREDDGLVGDGRDRMEREIADRRAAARAIYEGLVRRGAEDCIMTRGAGRVEQIHAEILQAVRSMLEGCPEP